VAADMAAHCPMKVSGGRLEPRLARLMSWKSYAPPKIEKTASRPQWHFFDIHQSHPTISKVEKVRTQFLSLRQLFREQPGSNFSLILKIGKKFNA